VRTSLAVADISSRSVLMKLSLKRFSSSLTSIIKNPVLEIRASFSAIRGNISGPCARVRGQEGKGSGEKYRL